MRRIGPGGFGETQRSVEEVRKALFGGGPAPAPRKISQDDLFNNSDARVLNAEREEQLQRTDPRRLGVQFDLDTLAQEASHQTGVQPEPINPTNNILKANGFGQSQAEPAPAGEPAPIVFKAKKSVRYTPEELKELGLE